MMGWSRNMNYCGEIMIYASFAIQAQSQAMWVFFIYTWGFLFNIRMQAKDYSLSMKEDWIDYSRKTWLLLPKIAGSTMI